MYIALDIGGTKTRIAASHNATDFTAPITLNTPKDAADGVALIAKEVQALTEGHSIDAIAVGVAGVHNSEKTTLLASPHLPGWVGKSLTELLHRELNVAISHIHLENDAALVGLGEAVSGAGVGSEIVAYITISTGVGGARIVKGAIDMNAYGFEPGHQVIDMDHTVAPFLGIDAEALVSGTATEIRFGKKAYLVTDPNVWEELSRFIACVVNNVCVLWSPHAVVLGGSMIVGEPAVSVERIRIHTHTLLTIFPNKPIIVKAALADVGGIYGGFAYLRSIYHIV